MHKASPYVFWGEFWQWRCSKQCSCTIVSNFERSDNFYNFFNFLLQATR